MSVNAITRLTFERTTMKKFLTNLVCALAITTSFMPAAKAQPATDEVLLKEVYSLLVENRAAAAAIASSMGIATSKVLPQPGVQAEMNNVLAVRNQHLFKQIAAKLGVDVATSIPTGGTIIEQNNLILRGNRMVVKEILLALGLDTSAGLPMKGSLVEQNRDLLLGNKNALKAISDKLGVK